MVDRSHSKRRIAVTGLGLLTPYGACRTASWRGLCTGRSAARWLTPEELAAPAGGALLRHHHTDRWAGAPAAPPCDPRVANPYGSDPVVRLACLAADEAVRESRLEGQVDPVRWGCVFGTSKGGLATAGRLLQETSASRYDADGASPNFWLMVPPSAAATVLAGRYGLQGPVLAPVAACATGLLALIRGAELIRDGVCDAVLAGSSDDSLLLPVLASYRRLGVLARPTFPPEEACRPFDRDRSGFVIGAGGAAFVLERWEHAIARGAPLLAEWIDGLARAAPAGLTLLPDDPADFVRLVRDLLARTGSHPADIAAVSLHGTGTLMNDRYEAAALRTVFDRAAQRPPGFALKGGIGHLLGGAGSVEAGYCVAALEAQQLPPSINATHPADDCRWPLSGPTAEPRALTRILKLSLGFGGHIAAALLGRPG